MQSIGLPVTPFLINIKANPTIPLLSIITKIKEQEQKEGWMVIVVSVGVWYLLCFSTSVLFLSATLSSSVENIGVYRDIDECEQSSQEQTAYGYIGQRGEPFETYGLFECYG